MKKNLMLKFDSLGGFALGIDLTDFSPEQYVTTINRINTMQPDPLAENIVLFHIGEYDDEKLTGELYPARRQIGDLMQSVKLLKEAAAKKRALEEVKENA